MYWGKKIRSDHALAVALLTMNRSRTIESDVPIMEEREVKDWLTGKTIVIRQQVGTRRGPVRTQAMPRAAIHRLTMGSWR